MTIWRGANLGFLAIVVIASLGAPWLMPDSSGTQNRDAILTGPSSRFVLGTDDLGRDVLARTLYGSRVSLFVAPASAFMATGIALLVGSAAGMAGGVFELLLHRTIDLFLSVPWIFLLLIVRAMLPLNLSPITSVFTTVVVLGAFGWASSARAVSESVRAINGSEYVAQARAQGIGAGRRLTQHVIPNLRPILVAQFWIAMPVFILGEANLGFLGLGVGEPVPSWGNLLKQLENIDRVMAHPWLACPLAAMVLVLMSVQVAFASRYSRA